ncbi:DUF6543 domain-containing protein [Pseudomonas sp. BP8]|uniref:DUF6543 domain-containing protein n=1 Tax=Pseudomonas sp. BP8 TaxID=2817864 RepID=UPI001AE9162B|nr:DUF6543 domain-containing protein [Pseudomonas sp. BP8]MBP2261416.1 hypothetical protein [Pseudomonas sp. BP8]HDS1735162.1 hypothetical protein [Pseudomonas putida]
MTLLRRLPRSAHLPCAVATRFQSRPGLFETAAQMLASQWQARGLDPTLNPLELLLVSVGQYPQLTYRRPLHQAVIERFCLRDTLNLTPDEDYLCHDTATDPAQALDVDLHEIEQLLNACGPLLIEHHQAAIVDFWSSADPQGQTPWQWYAAYLQDELARTLKDNRETSNLPATALALATQVHQHPGLLPDKSGVAVNLLEVDFSAGFQLDSNLASALLVEHPGEGHSRELVLFTAIGRLLAYRSRPDLFAAIAGHWPARLSAFAPSVQITPPRRPIFEGQALGLLTQQLKVINAASSTYLGADRAQELADSMDGLSGMAQMCSVSEIDHQAALFAHLPSWILNGEPHSLKAYSALLTDVAEGYGDASGRTWLDGVADAQAFALERLSSLVQARRPGSTLALQAIRVVNDQTVASAVPALGTPFIDGSIHRVEFTLAELAIGNLGLLRPGRVSIKAHDGEAVPAWFDEAALRELISAADIGMSYPQHLREELLDDPDKRRVRIDLLAAQLSNQLPAQAMTAHLRDGQISLVGVAAVAAVFNRSDCESPSAWSLRPLGLLRSMDAAADHPLNAWLIEATPTVSPRCLLYRPLHAEPLLEFSDRLELLVAIGTPGELQKDLLQRLPEEDRKVYAHGGFQEPHLVYPVEDDWAVPFSRPAPATLSREEPILDPGKRVYEACVEETLENFLAHSSSTAQTRWARWRELGWLLLNSVLPIMDGPFATAAWLVQAESALLHLVNDTDSSQDRTGDWIELLINVAFLVFGHASRRLEIEHPQPPTVPLLHVDPPLPAPAIVLTPEVPEPLDFAWAKADLTLDQAHLDALTALQAELPLSTLRAPIPSGPMAGLYLHDARLWVILQGKLYGVSVDPERGQLRITGESPGAPAGPWLRRDEAGRWQLDLKLRLNGGMPLGNRLAKQKQLNEQAVEALDASLAEDATHARREQDYLRKAALVAAKTHESKVLQPYIEKQQAFSAFWKDHLQRLKDRNESIPIREYKLLRASALVQRLQCEQSVKATLMRLYTPERSQLREVIQRQLTGYELTPADERIINERIERVLHLIEQLIANAEVMTAEHQQLVRLSSRAQPRIQAMLEQAVELMGVTASPQHWRFIRMECCTNRLMMIGALDGEGEFWLERGWDNIQVSVGQRLQLAELNSATDELKRRLLETINQHLGAAARQVRNLQQRPMADAAKLALAQLIEDLTALQTDVRSELAEYPDYPPSSSVPQLSRQLPGLIETQDHGLLLGQPRANDANLVDIPGPDPSVASLTYKLEDAHWVRLEQPSARPPTPASTPKKLKTLLQESRARMDISRVELGKLHTRSAVNYLPVEIEEIVIHQRDLLDAQRNAIEAQLTRDNQTDEALANDDSALVIKALEDLSLELTKQAPTLRTQAALQQKPRIAELEFLLEQGQVRIRAEGSRRLLARIKGRPADYLDEYAISHNDRVIWYAHFHYPSLAAENNAFTAGHLKTASQRYAQGKSVADPATGQLSEVYRSPITLAAAQRLFFPS